MLHSKAVTHNWFKEHKILTILITLVVLIVATLLFAFTRRDFGVLFARQKTFIYKDTERSYLISKPKEISSESKLIIGLHGFGDSPRRFAYYTALHNTAGNNIVIYPQASEPKNENQKVGWNAGFCCGSGWINDVDDVGYILALAESIKNEYNLDPTNTYVTGFSNGGFMTQRLAAEHPDKFSAVAVGSGSIGTNKKRLEPMSPIPILLMHGEKDKIVPFDGGPGSSDPDFQWLKFSQTKKTWEQINNSKAATRILTYSDDRHQWHDWRLFNFWHKKPEASIEVIAFFESNIK